MDDSNNARRHHHHGGGGAAEVVAGGNTGGGGGASNGLSLSLPLTLPLPGSSSVKPNASPPPPPLPPQPAGEPAGGDRAGAGGGRDDIWSQTATTTLIDAWGERYLELNRGNLKQKHWKEVAEAVNGRPSNNKQPKTDVQCKNRLDTLKKKYKVERSKIFAGGATKWPLFTKMDELIGPARKHHHHNQQPLPLPPPPPPLRPRRHPIESSPNLLNTATSPDMTESCLNGFNGNPSPAKRRKTAAAAAENPDSSPLKELAGAILKFGEVYERIEVVKHQQMMDLEKQRMEFAKDLELQRMHLFVQTQLELAKIKHAKHGNTEHYL